MLRWKKNAVRTARVTGWIAGIYLLLLFIAGLYINTQKEKIIQYVTGEMQEKLRGKASISNLEISVWRHFPNIAFQVHGFSLADSVYNTPIISANTVATTFSLFRLISSAKTVKNIIIEGGQFHLFTDSNGYSNKYLLETKEKKEAGKPAAGAGSIEIDDISIRDVSVTIEDKIANKEISMLINEINATVEQAGQLINIELEEKVTMKKGLGFDLSKGAYLENKTVAADWQLKMDKATQTLSFDKTNVSINDHPFVVSGHFAFDQSAPSFAINFEVKAVAFDQVQSIVTAAIRQKISLVSMNAPLDAQGAVAGSLLPAHEPAVDISWQTKDNTLVTPVAGFSQCSFTGNFMNSVHKDSLHNDPNSRITFHSFAGNWDGVQLTGKDIVITNLLEPQLHFVLHSDCKLQALDNKFALKDISFKAGEADLDLFYDGPVTRDNSMLQEMQGRLQVKNGSIEYVPRSFTFTNCNGDIGFFKDSISMRKFSCNYLKNKFDIEVEGKNIRRKFVANDISQEAIVKCYLRSPYINLEDFNSLFAPLKQKATVIKPPPGFAATARMLDAVLVNSIIQVDVKAADVKYGRMEARNFDADIKFHPHQWELARVSLNFAGGNIATNGKIIHNGATHNADVTTRVDNVDVQKLLYAFNNFGQDAVTHQNLRGSFSTTASLKTGINGLGQIIPASLYGKVDFLLKNGALENFQPFENLKLFVFRNRNMKDVRFAELKDKLEVKGTQVYVNRMEIASSVCRLFVEGNYCLLGKNTEMLVQVPFSNLNDNNFTEESATQNKGTKARVGMSVWLRAVNDETGKVKLKPTLSKKFKNKSVEEKAALRRA